MRDLAEKVQYFSNNPLEALNSPSAFKEVVLLSAAELPVINDDGKPNDHVAFVTQIIDTISNQLETEGKQTIYDMFGYNPDNEQEFYSHYYKELHRGDTPIERVADNDSQTSDWRANVDRLLESPSHMIDARELHRTILQAASIAAQDPDIHPSKDEAGIAITLLQESDAVLPAHVRDTLYAQAGFNPQDLIAYRKAFTPMTDAEPEANQIRHAGGEVNGIAFGGERPTHREHYDPLAYISQLHDQVSYKEQKNGHYLYLIGDDKLYTDQGEHLVMSKHGSTSDDAILVALTHGASKFGGVVEVTGSSDFKERVYQVMAKNNVELTLSNPSQQMAFEKVKALVGAEQTVASPIEMTPAQTTIGSEATDAQVQQAMHKDAGSHLQQQSPDSTQRPQSADTEVSESPKNDADSPEIYLFTGAVVAHGVAPFEFKHDRDDNYYVTLDTGHGEVTHWGKDLERAMSDAGADVGTQVELKQLGKTPVTLTKDIFDENGNKLEPKIINTFRNSWEVINQNAPSLSINMGEWKALQKHIMKHTNFDPRDLYNADQSLKSIPAALLEFGKDNAMDIRPLSPESLQSGNTIAFDQNMMAVSTDHPHTESAVTLFKGHGNYLQGHVRIADKLHHVIVPMQQNVNPIIYAVRGSENATPDLHPIGKLASTFSADSSLQLNINGTPVTAQLSNSAKAAFPMVFTPSESAQSPPEPSDESNDKAIPAARRESAPKPAVAPSPAP